MSINVNVSLFHQYNVTDTCAVWNVLSSRVLYSTASSTGCIFCITQYVMYECLHKGRKLTNHGPTLQNRLRQEQSKGNFSTYSLSIEDLQEVGILEKRRNLSKGELSSIVLAKKINQAFLTDDQKARKLAGEFLGKLVQTTPHLLGWLFFIGRLTDGDKQIIIDEHKNLGGLLEIYFEEIYQESLRCQLMQRNTADNN